MIGDAIPHPPSYGMNTLKLDWKKEAKQLNDELGCRIYSVQVKDFSVLEFAESLQHNEQKCLSGLYMEHSLYGKCSYRISKPHRSVSRTPFLRQKSKMSKLFLV